MAEKMTTIDEPLLKTTDGMTRTTESDTNGKSIL
jgi:hypothetical protein